MNVKALVMGAVFLVMICVPALLLPLFGAHSGVLYGEKEENPTSLSLASWTDDSFQNDFGGWFSQNFPGRVKFVELYNSISENKNSVNLCSLFGLTAAPAQRAGADNTQPASAAGQTTATEAPAPAVEPKYPEYVLQPEPLIEPTGFLGSATVIMGKSGCLFENGYINELYGYSPKYADETDAQLQARVAELKAIQSALLARGCQCMVVITPSKASMMTQYIPDWYMAKFTPAPDYVRPYIRFMQFLADASVNFIDSETVYKSVGLTDAFCKTGTHWNKMAAFETVSAMISEYETLVGHNTEELKSFGVLKSPDPPGFGNPEQDIFNLLYTGRSKAGAIVDQWYYYPDVSPVIGPDRPQIGKTIIQGGSFTGDMIYYLGNYNICSDITSYFYNNNDDTNIDWAGVLNGAALYVMEVNEQFVYGMGGNIPDWSTDGQTPDEGNNIIDSLYDYLTGGN